MKVKNAQGGALYRTGWPGGAICLGCLIFGADFAFLTAPTPRLALGLGRMGRYCRKGAGVATCAFQYP